MLKRISFLLLLGLLTLPVPGQQSMFKALFMFNFAKYIEWPNQESQKEFIIAVYGENEIIPELEKLAAARKINNKPIVIKTVKSPSEAPEAHLFYLPTNSSNKIDEVISFYKEKPTLIVTDKANLINKGAGINYITKGGKMKFEVKKSNITSHNLNVDPKLIALGIEIN